MGVVALVVGVGGSMVVACIVFVVVIIVLDRRRGRRQAADAEWIIADLYGNRRPLARRWSGSAHDDSRARV